MIFYYAGIGRTPYEAVFGIKPKLGVASDNLPNTIVSILETEEQLAEAFNEISDPIQQIPEEIDIAPNASSSPRQSETTVVTYICVSCQRISSGAHSCRSCGLPCHAIPPCSIPEETEEEGFGSAVLCKICHQKDQIINHRECAKKTQRKQAEKMFEQSAKRFKPAKIGDTVMVPVPDVDRGKSDFRNIEAVVLTVEENGVYKLGTKHGLLNSHYARNQFTPCLEKFLDIKDLETDKEISLREAARYQSVGTGQGIFHCTCKKNCLNKTCKCYRSNRICNSRCHSSRGCSNK